MGPNMPILDIDCFITSVIFAVWINRTESGTLAQTKYRTNDLWCLSDLRPLIQTTRKMRILFFAKSNRNF